MHDLVAHPATPPKAIKDVQAQLLLSGPCELWMEFHVRSGEDLLLPEEKPPERADGLWETTCFELFVDPHDAPGYLEFNFSPSLQWAAYGFEGYRTGMRELPFRDPEICLFGSDQHLSLAVEAFPELPAGALKLGLSAVIEEADGTKSYWALAHPAEKPDFHHPAGFVLDLPTPEGDRPIGSVIVPAGR